ncbi:ribonuclease P protein component [Candidatus Kinetoplastibacterium desouzaii TCC079E]|uniref:Ribonuclease P protein component n=1 Tax=Candidatus Kinetoplastidibacterium desouzai TCC079E TaxID=1208919 RepID=M1L3J7_9PROT|nr:ribonuclease P protein component [Candidatus Kinetoplastibacterium desouzaii]AGF47303.1 ribonuclease P protein component [Candidatus Kinetoplastibacterium desouzaii TCC079E]
MNTKYKKTAKFPATARLHKSYEYKAVLNGKILSKGRFFSVNSALCMSEDKMHLTGRIGLVISKKMARNAIIRNAIKRVIRESFRLNIIILPRRDYVVRLCNKIPLSSLRNIKKNVRSEIDYHFNKISKCTKI